MKLFKGIILAGATLIALSAPVFAEDNGNGNNFQGNMKIYQQPYTADAYGPGVNSDATGRPFEWRTLSGQKVMPGTPVKPDGYGMWTGMDAYGRPVRPYGR